jgi:glycosyltransferase involved in cell wall biosynthesis
VRVIFINRFYWPDEPATAQLLTDFAEACVAAGHEVIIVTSHPGKATVTRHETHRGVRIERVRSARTDRPGVVHKTIDFATFHLAAFVRLFALARRGDAIVALTDPPLIGITAAFVAALRGARLFHWVQDIYPEIAIELTGRRVLGIFKPFRNLAWRRADACITLGTDMAGVLVAAGVTREKIHVVSNWPPAGLQPQPPAAAAVLRAEWQLEHKFVVAYSGNLGRVHDLGPVLELAAALRDDPRIAFVFIGGGAQRAALEAEALERRLTNVQFRPPQPRAQLARALALGDVHLVTLRPGCERFVFPSKLYGLAAVGRPAIVIAPPACELSRLVVQHRFGVAFDRTAIPGLAAELRALAADPAACARLGMAAAEFARTVGDATAALARWPAPLGRAQAC